jgi:hypothetical protein
MTRRHLLHPAHPTTDAHTFSNCNSVTNPIFDGNHRRVAQVFLVVTVTMTRWGSALAAPNVAADKHFYFS